MMKLSCLLLAVGLLMSMCSDFVMNEKSSSQAATNRAKPVFGTDSSATSPKQSLELRISFANIRCKKGGPCVLRIEAHNPAEASIELAGLGIWLRPFQGQKPIDFSGYLNASVDIVDLKQLQSETRGNSVTIGPDQTWTKEVDLATLEWHKSIQSSLAYKPLWDRVSEGKYEARVEVGVISSEIPQASNANIGGVEVDMIKIQSPRSNWEGLEFVKQ